MRPWKELRFEVGKKMDPMKKFYLKFWDEESRMATIEKDLKRVLSESIELYGCSMRECVSAHLLKTDGFFVSLWDLY